MPDESPYLMLQRLRNFFRVNIKWFTRSAMLILFLFMVLNPIIPNFMKSVGTLLGFSEPSLITIIGVSVLFFLLERTILIEDEIKHPSLHIYQTKEEAYDDLPKHVVSRKVDRVDFLQFSGHSALRFLREVAGKWPKAEVRILLFHPDLAREYDLDRRHGHVQRIFATIDQIEVLEEGYKNNGFKVQVRYYRTLPSISAIIVGSSAINISWYRSFPNHKTPEIIHLRGHDSLAITGKGETALLVLAFVQEHFDALWATSEDVPAGA